jgi:hypothetical protein
LSSRKAAQRLIRDLVRASAPSKKEHFNTKIMKGAKSTKGALSAPASHLRSLEIIGAKRLRDLRDLRALRVKKTVERRRALSPASR